MICYTTYLRVLGMVFLVKIGQGYTRVNLSTVAMLTHTDSSANGLRLSEALQMPVLEILPVVDRAIDPAHETSINIS